MAYLPMVPFMLVSWRGRYDNPETTFVLCISIVMLCGNGGMVPVYRVCHMVVPLPSKTFPAAYVAEASLSAEAVQPARGKAGPIGGSPPNRPISAADDHGPRLPASV